MKREEKLKRRRRDRIKVYSILSLICLGCGAGLSDEASARDRTPPVVEPTIVGALGSNGWYTGNVQLSWNVTDNESRIRQTTGCSNVSITADTSGATYTCIARSYGGTTTKSVTIKRDATPPLMNFATPANGAVYAQGETVKASYNCNDAASGINTCTGTVANGSTLDLSTAGSKSVKITASDQAGNTASNTVSYTVKPPADTTPPVISATVNGTQGNNGWYTGNVAVSWSVVDPESPIVNSSGCTNVSVTSDTSGMTYTCTAASSGGTSSKSVTVKRDAPPPQVTISTPGTNATYPQGQTVKASYSCSDATSGIWACIGTVANGGNLDLSTTGSKSFNVNASDQAGNTATSSRSYTVSSSPTTGTPPPAVNGTHLFAWNDLGMHCTDSDFSIFTLLPPFNDLVAQLIVNGKLVNTANSSAYSLVYESTPDPTGSINTWSVGKTNFWDYDLPLFGADLPADVGLTGNPTASRRPAPLAWSGEYNWFEATGIPITPFDDNLNENYFPMVRVTAIDSSGKAIASADAVLPVSSEINCFSCHGSNVASNAAKPAKGWVNLAPGSEQDWRLNILRLHDEKNSGPNYTALLSKKGYTPSLEASAVSGNPILCDSCHNSNALAIWGIVGETGVSNMTAAMHNRHANVSLPGSSASLNNIPTRESCFNCHPGKKTQCLRGAMGNPVTPAGDHLMECQSCHGNMQTVGKAAREGWFDMPTCQSCHHDGVRETVAIKADGTFKSWSDTRFASNPDTPAPGTSLYRFSTGHGNVQCEACHNSTHAEYTDKPSASGNQVNDNLQAIKTQGYAASIRECSVCHANEPFSINGGPHGMHSLGQSWVTQHHDAFNQVSKSSCYYCHGTTSSGSPLAVVKVAKTFNNGDGRSKTFAVNERVTCWSCHNGPNP